MIRLADRDILLKLSCDDPFYTRVLSLFESYGAGYDFVGFWYQENEGEVSALISRFEDKFSLYLTDGAELEETAAFLSFQGAGSVMYNSRYGLDIPHEREISGQALRYKGEIYNSDIEIYSPDPKSLYELIKACESEIFIVPDYMMFLSDVTHRSNLDKCTISAARVGGALASSVMTVSETEFAAILGAVCTHPDYRRRGLSRELVRDLSSRLTQRGRAVYVFSASDNNTRFYQGSGFEIYSGFTELFF